MNSTVHNQGSGKAMDLQEAGVGHHAEHDRAESQGVMKGSQHLP